MNILRRVRQQKNSTAASNARKKRDVFQDIQTYFKNSDANNNDHNLEEKIGLYIITPTYPRPEQLPELTRLSQTLMVCEFIDLLPNFNEFYEFTNLHTNRKYLDFC